MYFQLIIVNITNFILLLECRGEKGREETSKFSTCDSPAAQRSRASEAVGDRDNFLGDDGQAVSREVRKAIAGVEARRGIRDEKAVEPAYNKRRPEQERQAEHRRSPVVAERKTAAEAAAGMTSKDGNDDNRRREERRQGEEEERKTPRGTKPSEDNRVAREECRTRTPHWEEEEEPIDAVVVAEEDSGGGDAMDESWKTAGRHHRRRLTNWRSSFVLQSSRKKMHYNERRRD